MVKVRLGLTLAVVRDLRSAPCPRALARSASMGRAARSFREWVALVSPVLGNCGLGDRAAVYVDSLARWR